MSQNIMLETNKQKFFTNKKTLKELKSFIKKFKVKIYTVNVFKEAILNSKQLALAIAANEGQNYEYKITKEINNC